MTTWRKVWGPVIAILFLLTVLFHQLKPLPDVSAKLSTHRQANSLNTEAVSPPEPDYSIILERSLFDQQDAAVPKAGTTTDAEGLALTAIYRTGTVSTAVFLASATGERHQARIGESIGNRVITEIDRYGVTIRTGTRFRRFDLKTPLESGRKGGNLSDPYPQSQTEETENDDI